jgi:putative PIN family toxin of toxin-antitoxin system
MRVVVDTNVLISAVIKPSGNVGRVLLLLRDGRYTILCAQSLLAELVDVLNRPRMHHKYHLTNKDIETVVALILLRGQAVRPQRQITICRDPKDNKFLKATFAGDADAIVSGDEDLLSLNSFEGIPIISPRDFLDLFEAAES